MGQENSAPVYFSPKGLSDTLDATEAFPGAMASLQNLNFDPSSPNVLQCRPAAIQLLSGAAPIPQLGFVSDFYIVGSVVYVLAATSLNAGYDQPFAYDLAAGAIVPVANITPLNVPKSPPTSGAWTPPTMDLVGTKLVVTHPGFASAQASATATDTITFSANPAGGDTMLFGLLVTDQAGIPGTLVTFVYTTPIIADGQVQIVPNSDTITFAIIPSNGDTITLNGTVVKFVTGAPSGNQVQIGADLAATLVRLENFLSASADPQISLCLYSVSSTVLTIKYNGVTGNGSAYAVAASAATVASPTLINNMAGTIANFVTFAQNSGDPNLALLTYAVGGTTVTVSYVTPGADGNTYPISSASGSIAVATPTLTGGSGLYFGWFELVNPSAPVWNAGNMSGTPLPSIPVAVKQFNSRAYFMVNPPNGQPALIPSDPLQATQNSNGSYVLTFGDNIPLSALGALPLSNQLGGIIQALMIFKDESNIIQVTGDPLPNTAAGPWTKNTLNVATGTNAPRTICSTPQGLMFMSPQGLRLIDFNGAVSPPIGANGTGVSIPFINCPTPSRMAAACNASVMRVSVPALNGPILEFWYDLVRQVWTGPHTLAANVIAPYQNTFIIAPTIAQNSLWQSDWIQNAGSTFNEGGVPLTWNFLPALFPDTRNMAQHEMHEVIVLLACANPVTINGIDEEGNVLADSNGNGAATCAIASAGASNSNWGAAQWAYTTYANQTFALSPVQVPWATGVVFGRMSLQLTGTSDSVTRIGAINMRYETLGYLPQPGN